MILGGFFISNFYIKQLFNLSYEYGSNDRS